MLVQFFRNPLVLKVVGGLAAIAFLFPLVGRKNTMKFIAPLVAVVLLFVGIRGLMRRRRRKLTELEEEYLKRRFYEH